MLDAHPSLLQFHDTHVHTKEMYLHSYPYTKKTYLRFSFVNCFQGFFMLVTVNCVRKIAYFY